MCITRTMLALGLAWLFASASLAAPAELDLAIVGGRVLDGSGNPWMRADVGVRDGRIVKVGDLQAWKAKRVIRADGRYVVPGFIDLHNHADDQEGHWRGVRAQNPKRRAAVSHVTQGITTGAVNSDGLAPDMSVAQQMDVASRLRPGINVLYMSAHNRIRARAMNQDIERAASAEEIRKMVELLEADLSAGAWGLAASMEGLEGRWATTEELIELNKVVAAHDGAFAAHPRSQGNEPYWYVPSQYNGLGTREAPRVFSTLDATLEMIEISEHSGARAVISHFMHTGIDKGNYAARSVEAIEAARGRGVQIFADQHVYSASPSALMLPLQTIIPRWAMTGRVPMGSYTESRVIVEAIKPDMSLTEGLRITLSDPVLSAAMRQDMRQYFDNRRGLENIRVMDHPRKEYIGKTLQELARELGMSAVDLCIKLQLEGDPAQGGGGVYLADLRPQESIDVFLNRPWVAGTTDGYLSLPEDGPTTHPQTYAAFPALIKWYVVDRGKAGLADVIRSFTSLPARIAGLNDRGMIREGYAADLSILDLQRLKINSTFGDPHHYTTGFDYVFVNGVAVVDDGAVTWALPGEVLKKR